jgi:hypothetical protein
MLGSLRNLQLSGAAAGWTDRAQRFFRQLIVHGWIIAGLFGTSYFFVVAGSAPLDVRNVGWIFRHNDIATAQVGWTFYRYAPWSLQIALNPTYGMDFGGSIIFSDAVPLMAITFKALSPVLPSTFQYFGFWVLASFVLQGVFGWILISRATNNSVARILGACIISLTPPYCFRLVSPLCAHMSLTAHWIILAALCLCLPPHSRRPWLWWGLLLSTSAFVHIYIFAMVATLWCADVARRGIVDTRRTWMEPFGVAGVLAALISLTGVWAGPAGEYQGGFGWFKMNVFAFIDPNMWGSANRPWSVLMPDIPNWGGDYEGFAYLGLGGLLLAVISAWALPTFLREHSAKPAFVYVPLAVVLVGMGVFAMSQNVTFGTLNFYVPWPAPLRALGELFRSTGRFIWPLYYFTFFAAMLVIAHRVSPRVLTTLLGGIVIIQAVDIAPGWSSANAYLRDRGPGFQTRLTSSFWGEAARHYKAMRLAPHTNNHASYLDVATLARARGMMTDAAYLSRTSTAGAEASRARIEHGITTGIWPADTLFVADEEVARRASATLDSSRNFLARVDGFIVIAPAWQGCSDCGAVPVR